MLNPALRDLISKTRHNRTGRANEYITSSNLIAYIRITKHLIGDTVIPTIDIANVTVAINERRKGEFKAFLTMVENEAEKENRTVFIESVLCPFLLTKLPEYGYLSVPNSNPPSFYKRK